MSEMRFWRGTRQRAAAKQAAASDTVDIEDVAKVAVPVAEIALGANPLQVGAEVLAQQVLAQRSQGRQTMEERLHQFARLSPQTPSESPRGK